MPGGSPGPWPGGRCKRRMGSPGLWANFSGVARMNEPKPTMMLSSSFGKPGARRMGSPNSKPLLVATSTRVCPGSAGSVMAVRCSTNGVVVAVGGGGGVGEGDGVSSSSPPAPPSAAGGVAVATGVPLFVMLITGFSALGSNSSSAWVPSWPSMVAMEDVPPVRCRFR